MNEQNHSRLRGLSAAEVAERRARYGPNELPGKTGRGLLKMVAEALREPLLLLLVGASAVYLVIGDIHEGLLLAALTVADLGLVVYQDFKTERVLDSLRDLASPRALVIRDGMQQRIAGRDVVPGDILVVADGDRTPADAILLSASDLAADESLLTGESVPVRKRARPAGSEPPPAQPGGEDLPYIFSGTLIVRGQGAAEVIATGGDTEMGRIGMSLAGIDVQETRLRSSTRRLAKDMTLVGGAVSVLVIVLYGARIGDWVAAVLAGVTTAMSLMPEEIPVVLTVFMTLGAWRISRRRVLTRRLSAIESLGSATVLFTDKTGTLTENRMRVARLSAAGDSFDLRAHGTVLSDGARTLLATAMQACEPNASDPMERAVFAAGGEAGLPVPEDVPIQAYGLRDDLLATTYVWRGTDSTEVAAKGAPESIARLCRLDKNAQRELLRETGKMAERGLRVLAVARTRHDGPLPETPSTFVLELVGLVGLSDPVRATVPPAVDECRQAGIRVVMVTGDYPQTARAIARDAGLDGESDIITGEELVGMDDDTLAAQLPHTNIFARVRPEQKLRLVTAARASGEIVAMTGDGVNDAPALKAADIGIAMGERGSDVAREAATLVLLDDAFESIAAAVRLGRRIYDNLRKALSYVLAIHIPIAGVALAPLLVGWPIVFSPVHIVFLELIIDPVCSIVFEAEPEEPDIMRRPPRDPRAPLFGHDDLIYGLIQGTLGMVAILIAYDVALNVGLTEPAARAVAFVGVVTVNVMLVMVNRSRALSLLRLLRPNAALWWVLGVALFTLGLSVYLAPAAQLFSFAPLGPGGVALALAPALAVLAGTEILKAVRPDTPSMRQQNG